MKSPISLHLLGIAAAIACGALACGGSPRPDAAGPEPAAPPTGGVDPSGPLLGAPPSSPPPEASAEPGAPGAEPGAPGAEPGAQPMPHKILPGTTPVERPPGFQCKLDAPKLSEDTCKSDADCAPSDPCHAHACVAVAKANPPKKDTICTYMMDCQSVDANRCGCHEGRCALIPPP